MKLLARARFVYGAAKRFKGDDALGDRRVADR